MKYLGTIAATTAKDNGNTAAPFTIPGGGRVSLQGDAAFYVLPVDTTGTAVTAVNGIQVNAGQLFDIDLVGAKAVVSVLPVSTSANVKVWARIGQRSGY